MSVPCCDPRRAAVPALLSDRLRHDRPLVVVILAGLGPGAAFFADAEVYKAFKL
jgi:hypothetical protein